MALIYPKAKSTILINSSNSLYLPQGKREGNRLRIAILMAGPHKGLSTIKQILRTRNKPNQIFLLSALNKGSPHTQTALKFASHKCHAARPDACGYIQHRRLVGSCQLNSRDRKLLRKRRSFGGYVIGGHVVGRMLLEWCCFPKS
jgi:hypothetical protein